ncbi:MAG: mechanosensitive ion channel family protein, partial [Thermoanaerobaculia bacterium]
MAALATPFTRGPAQRGKLGLEQQEGQLEDPEALVKVHKLTDSATQFVVRPWVKQEDYWQAYWDLTREAKLRLDREKIALGI